MMKRIREHEKFWWRYAPVLTVVIALVFSGCAWSPKPIESVEPPKPVENMKTTEVLFIGNSYSFGVPKAFRKLARERGKKLRVGTATQGGWTLEQHEQHAPTLEKLKSRDWDIVVIQEQSQRPALTETERRAVMDGPVQFFVDQAKAIGATPMLYQTWGRRDGLEWVEGDDFYQMNERLRNGYRSAAERAGGVEVISAGDAWEREYQAGRGTELFQEDGSHPSEFGDRVTAEVFYDAIFKNGIR